MSGKRARRHLGRPAGRPASCRRKDFILLLFQVSLQDSLPVEPGRREAFSNGA